MQHDHCAWTQTLRLVSVAQVNVTFVERDCTNVQSTLLITVHVDEASAERASVLEQSRKPSESQLLLPLQLCSEAFVRLLALTSCVSVRPGI